MTALALPVFDPRLTQAADSAASASIAAPQEAFVDRQGRTIRYLRLSLTSACAMRCIYCRPATFNPADAQHGLNAGQIEHLVRHLVHHHGLRKVRLTGGDPSSRPDLIEIVGRLSDIDGLDELVMTTHGLTLARDAAALADAGLQRINISLDSLDADRFERLTGVAGLRRVLDGIDAALDAGLAPVRLNCVVIRGENDRELPELVSFAADRGVEMRFIELMPMGPLAPLWHERYVPEDHMREILHPHARAFWPLPHAHESARRYRVTLLDGRSVIVGFITPMSCNFCASCQRVRISSDGNLYPCLMDHPAGSLLPALVPSFQPELFDRLLAEGLSGKQDHHPATGFATMTQIGG